MIPVGSAMLSWPSCQALRAILLNVLRARQVGPGEPYLRLRIAKLQ
jgi:hypothetical protein